MSCTNGDKSCETPRRSRAMVILLLMLVIFLVLSVFSFVDSRGQVVPTEITYNEHQAIDGKKVFQSYNCMGCHTIVGNGAYLGPDLTKVYRDLGPAWLEAFIPSAGSWPTEAAVKTHLLTADQLATAEVGSYEEYLEKYPNAFERISRRGGQHTNMPNLPFREGEVGQLIAFFKYTSAMNNEGWPPTIKAGDLDRRLSLVYGAPVAQAAAVETSTEKAVDLVAQGKKIAEETGCLACHGEDETRKIGPGWGNMYGNPVALADGSTVTADKTYLVDSIVNPDAQIVAGYPAGVMPPYSSLLQPEQVDAIVAYLMSLSEAEE